MSGEELRDGIVGASLVICNDYEMELIRQKTGMNESDILQKSEALIVTKGENGSSILERGSQIDVKAVEPSRIADPTGVGDAYRGGFMKGLAIGADYRTCAQLGSVAATYALEHLGGSSHAYSRAEFTERYSNHFGPLTMTL
jgi:adenosine kinase